MKENIKLYSAIAFQFLILGVLSAALFMMPEFRELILGALIGLAVGIGVESIKK